MKIHLLMTKEEVQEEKLKSGRKIAVVFDVLLATTTITAALGDGALAVIPAENREEALRIAAFLPEEKVLAGEYDAKPISGFHYPSPFMLRDSVKGKTLVLSTTNGTVALKKAAAAEKVFISCLLNNPAAAREVFQECSPDTTLVLICSGNSGELSLEDFYGAGHFIDCLAALSPENTEVSDAAQAACLFYRGNKEKPLEILQRSRVGTMLKTHGLSADLELASYSGALDTVPVLQDGRIIRRKPSASP
ncbi:2-phosphosulfolactate phosphatase [Peribacillus kribbensis]|uniref:2-phosphosulfolactate phosphatase n=1 Tax=Peribacillus kribbensis TaxID=356658 RepID=UPI0004076966|nr:2-phosphosulfolactate phosphatase [Peribacillus kribbensis]